MIVRANYGSIVRATYGDDSTIPLPPPIYYPQAGSAYANQVSTFAAGQAAGTAGATAVAAANEVAGLPITTWAIIGVAAAGLLFVLLGKKKPA